MDFSWYYRMQNNITTLGRVPTSKSCIFCIGMKFLFFQHLKVSWSLPVARIIFLKRCYGLRGIFITSGYVVTGDKLLGYTVFLKLDREFFCILPSLVWLYSATVSPSLGLCLDGLMAIIHYNDE